MRGLGLGGPERFEKSDGARLLGNALAIDPVTQGELFHVGRVVDTSRWPLKGLQETCRRGIDVVRELNGEMGRR